MNRNTVTSPKRSGTSPPQVRPYLVLTICCASLLLIGMDVTIINVALPAIQLDLHASLAGLQWVIDAYTLTLASLLIFSGSMADRYGRRRVFLIGLTVFCVGSLLCSLAHSIGGLIAYRVVQGLGATMLNPVALSIIVHVFPDPKERVRAIGIWGAMMGIALAVGPVLGGALTQTIGWRSIFWINLPICVVAVALTARFMPESKAKRSRAFDPAGQVLALGFLLTLTYAIIESPQNGWTSASSLVLFAVAALCMILFLVFEPRCREPLINPRFFRSVPFTGAFVLAVICYASYLGVSLPEHAIPAAGARLLGISHRSLHASLRADDHHPGAGFGQHGGPLRPASIACRGRPGTSAEHAAAYVSQP